MVAGRKIGSTSGYHPNVDWNTDYYKYYYELLLDAGEKHEYTDDDYIEGTLDLKPGRKKTNKEIVSEYENKFIAKGQEPVYLADDKVKIAELNAKFQAAGFAPLPGTNSISKAIADSYMLKSVNTRYSKVFKGKTTVQSYNVKSELRETFVQETKEEIVQRKKWSALLTEDELWTMYFTERSLYLDTIVVDQKTHEIKYLTTDGQAPGYWKNYPEWFQKKVIEYQLDAEGHMVIETKIENLEKQITKAKIAKNWYSRYETWLSKTAGVIFGGGVTALAALQGEVTLIAGLLCGIFYVASLVLGGRATQKQNELDISYDQIAKYKRDIATFNTAQKKYESWLKLKEAEASKKKKKPEIIWVEDLDAQKLSQ